MRTPREMAAIVVGEDDRTSEGLDRGAALLSAWRDECVAEARKPEAPASEDDWIERVMDWYRNKHPEGMEQWLIDKRRRECDELRALLSRAPRAEAAESGWLDGLRDVLLMLLLAKGGGS